MSVHDKIESVRGNIVDVSNPTDTTSDNLNQLSDKLSSPDIKDLLPTGKTGKDLIGDSMLCRLQELGDKIEDLIEDGFGLGSIIDGFKMPSMSEIGEKLKQMNPLNLLDKLNNISLESITDKAGELINGVMDKIEGVVTDTFNQIERAVKGIDGMFDEFGDRIEDLGQFAQDTITGIVGGLGEVLQDITKPIEDLIDTLSKPCGSNKVSAKQQAQQNLQANVTMFDTDIEEVRGNVVSMDSIGHTSGKFTSIIREKASESIPVVVPIGASEDPKYRSDSPDAVHANKQENREREEAERAAVVNATDAATDAVVKEVRKEQNSQKKEISKEDAVSATNSSGEIIENQTIFAADDCDSIIKSFEQKFIHTLFKQINPVWNQLIDFDAEIVTGNKLISLEVYVDHFKHLVLALEHENLDPPGPDGYGDNKRLHVVVTEHEVSPQQFVEHALSTTAQGTLKFEQMQKKFLVEPSEFKISHRHAGFKDGVDKIHELYLNREQAYRCVAEKHGEWLGYDSKNTSLGVDQLVDLVADGVTDENGNLSHWYFFREIMNYMSVAWDDSTGGLGVEVQVRPIGSQTVMNVSSSGRKMLSDESKFKSFVFGPQVIRRMYQLL